MAHSKEGLSRLIADLFDANAEYARLTGEPSRQRLGNPASDAALQALEQSLGISLPEDYKAFMRLHDGWIEFDEELAILSVAELAAGPVHDWLRLLKSEWGDGTPGLREGLVIVAAKGQSSLVYLDLAKRRKDGGFDVVEWDEGDEVDRYRSFTAYLKETLSVVRELIEDEN